MLKRFELKNYKNFKDGIVVDFSKTGGYQYNTDCILNDTIGKMLIYGKNASGKTNLGRAMMDLYFEMLGIIYPYDSNLVNADSIDDFIDFSYNFIFEGIEVNYNYSKKENGNLRFEKLYIDNIKIFECDYNEDFFDFENLDYIGAETINAERYKQVNYRDNNDKTKTRIFFLRWLLANTAFDNNSVMIKFQSYIESMSIFSVSSLFDYKIRPLYERFYDILEDKRELNELEKFINEMGINCKLAVKKLPDGHNELYFKHKKLIPFMENASSGTVALLNLYFGFIRNLRSNSFVYLDEFDAFYHYEMADKLVQYFKKSFKDTQIIMTTHNTNLMTNRIMRPDCIFILSSWGSLTPLCDATERELREGHNLEKMYISGEFEKYE